MSSLCVWLCDRDLVGAAHQSSVPPPPPPPPPIDSPLFFGPSSTMRLSRNVRRFSQPLSITSTYVGWCPCCLCAPQWFAFENDRGLAWHSPFFLFSSFRLPFLVLLLMMIHTHTFSNIIYPSSFSCDNSLHGQTVTKRSVLCRTQSRTIG